ncbi:MAG TPA: hypothetical protein VM123_04900 [archaeon]|nr:hypothetical protein [archaeon]
MSSLRPILPIARYEAKILFRSWFFRIFSLLALAILILLNVMFFGHSFIQWQFRGIPSSIPYFNLLLLNVAQAVIGMFLASDFLKYDRRLDTTDVIYTRSMTNAVYVLGKTLGVLAVFGVLNILVLIISLVSNFFFASVPVVAEVYVLYPLLISLPTLIFIFGLSFLLMALTRSQAVTFIVLLGYIAITIFFLGPKFHCLFDYMAFNVPLWYSDFVGFGRLSTIVIHRGIYFLLGLGFIFTTILLLKRLPQSPLINRMSLLLAVACIAGGVLLGRAHLNRLSAGKELRTKMTALNRDLARAGKVSLTFCGLDLIHQGNRIEVKARLTFTNKTPNALDRYLFSLNTGLEVTGVSRLGKDIPFSRNLHILCVEPGSALQVGALDSLTISYNGVINEEACYLDQDEETREQANRFFLYNADKRYGFISGSYVLLTPETLWYPRAGLPEGAAYPNSQKMDFITFSLRVKTAGRLRAVSQGEVTEQGSGVFVFRPEVPLPKLSLAIGDYESRSVTVIDPVTAGSLDYAVYTLKGHDYFSRHLKDLSGKLPEIIRDVQTEYENRLGLSYPYRRLLIVETPIQFIACPRIWTLATETVQPEMVLLPEQAVILQSADFRLLTLFMERMAQREGVTQTPEEVQKNLLRRFINETFMGGSTHFQRAWRSFRRSGSGSFARRTLEPLFMPGSLGSYAVFPLCYSYAHHFTSDKWPIFNTAMEFYLNARVEKESADLPSITRGISSEEQANSALMKQSLGEILSGPRNNEIIPDVMLVKSAYLFNLLQSELGKESFEEFLRDYLESKVFAESSAEDFVTAINDRFGFDLEPYIDSWLHQKKLPAFLLTDLDSYEILEQGKTRYQVVFKVSNPGPVEGLFGVRFRTAEGREEGMSPWTEERIYRLEGGQHKEIGIVLDHEPRLMRVNTFISRNLPSVLERRFYAVGPRKDAEPFEGEGVIEHLLTFAEPGSIIVDNEDPGFEIQALESEGYLKKLLKRSNGNEDKYIVGLRYRRLPYQWEEVAQTEFYGSYRHTAYYIRSGEGGKKVSWKAELPRSGKYDVYYYVNKLRNPGLRAGNTENYARDFHFTVYHDDGASERELDIESAPEGWYLLDTYYFSQGTATVELTDQSKGRMVYADAVKWVEHK